MRPTMRTLLMSSLVLLATLTSSLGRAQTACEAGSTCVPPEDLKQIVKVLEEKQCLQGTKPSFTLDPVTIVTDRDGRLYYSAGSTPSSRYQVKMNWCNYSVTGSGSLQVVYAPKAEKSWGWDLRIKPIIGILPLRLLEGAKPLDSTEIGALIEPFHWKVLSINVLAGARGIGIGPALAVTRTVDLFAGYHLSYGAVHGGVVGVSVSLW